MQVYLNRLVTYSPIQGLEDLVAYAGKSIEVYGGVGVVGLIDRYGNVYGGRQGGIGPSLKWNGGGTLIGGGYLEKPFSNQVPTEEQLKGALEGVTISVGGDAGIVEASIFGTLGYWGYYTSIGAHLPGVTLVGASYTKHLGKDDSLGWYHFEHGISPAYIKYGVNSKISCGCKQ